jgi:uncharacterized coiled-coil protein SlyX
MADIPGTPIPAASTSCSGSGTIINNRLHVTLNTHLSFDLEDLPGHTQGPLAAEIQGLTHRVIELERGFQEQRAYITTLENQLTVERSNCRISELENARLADEVRRLTKALKDGSCDQLDGEKPADKSGQELSKAMKIFGGNVGDNLQEWFGMVEDLKRVLYLDDTSVVDFACAHMSDEVREWVQSNTEDKEKEVMWFRIKYWLEVGYGGR